MCHTKWFTATTTEISMLKASPCKKSQMHSIIKNVHVTENVKLWKSLLQDVNSGILEKSRLHHSKKKKDSFLTSHSSLSILINIYTIISRYLPFSSNQMLLIEICKDWTFLYIPWSVQAMKPLKRLKQTELMYCNYSPLLRLLWRYIAGNCECHLCWKPKTTFLSGSVGVSSSGFRWPSEHV